MRQFEESENAKLLRKFFAESTEELREEIFNAVEALDIQGPTFEEMFIGKSYDAIMPAQFLSLPPLRFSVHSSTKFMVSDLQNNKNSFNSAA